jgi:hypothetical protein
MRVRRPWTSEEDKLLSHHAEINSKPRFSVLTLKVNLTLAVKIGNDKLWNKVALSLPGRTNKDCRKRWMKLGAHLKKGSWTKEEDQLLQNAVDEVGCK